MSNPFVVHMCVCEQLPVMWVLRPWTVASQAPRPWGFSRQECSNGLLCPLPGDTPSLGSNIHPLCNTVNGIN